MSETKKLPVLRPEDILEKLKNGMTREEIGEELNLSPKAVKVMFQHPLLKNKKVGAKPEFIWAEDVEDTIEEVNEDGEAVSAEEIASKESPEDNEKPEEIRNWNDIAKEVEQD